MTSENKEYQNNTLARGFIIFDHFKNFPECLEKSSVHQKTMNWQKTYFGPTEIRYDNRLHYASESDKIHGVGILGLCVNPFDNTKSNQKIAKQLYHNLKIDEKHFFNYVDQLSGSFVIIYRTNARVKILQDCAATKSIYYTTDSRYGTIAASHINLIATPLSLPADERVRKVFQNELYKKDPSRYLPGMITSNESVDCLIANTYLDLTTGNTKRFFPREPLQKRVLDRDLIETVANIMRNQARLLAQTERPLFVATTAGRDSRVSLAAFSPYDNARFFSFHIEQSGHLTEDVEIAKQLTCMIGKELEVFDLGAYKDSSFKEAFSVTSPNGIWPAAAQCYIKEFPENAIHIRSTVSEIGRMFYKRRSTNSVTAEGLARTYTTTDFFTDELVIETMRDFICRGEFSEKNFFNYDLHDMFYWEHRNSKWQNVLCQEAEMATDVFIPFNNRRLIMLFLGLPENDRKSASLHEAITKEMCPEIAKIPYIS